jgi:hypothetical protein
MSDGFFLAALACFAALSWAILILCDRLMGVQHERN